MRHQIDEGVMCEAGSPLALVAESWSEWPPLATPIEDSPHDGDREYDESPPQPEG